MSLLQIYQWVCQWKNFENRLTFGKILGKSLVSCFFWDTVYLHPEWNSLAHPFFFARRQTDTVFFKLMVIIMYIRFNEVNVIRVSDKSSNALTKSCAGTNARAAGIILACKEKSAPPLYWARNPWVSIALLKFFTMWKKTPYITTEHQEKYSATVWNKVTS